MVADLSADDSDLAVLLLDTLDQVRNVDEEFAVEVRAAGAVPGEQVVPRPGRGLGGRARGDVRHGDMIDRDLNLVLRSPVPCELVEPLVIRRDKMAPLHDRQRPGVGHRAGYEWRRENWCRACREKGEPCILQEPASRGTRQSGRAHLRFLLFSVPVRECESSRGLVSSTGLYFGC